MIVLLAACSGPDPKGHDRDTETDPPVVDTDPPDDTDTEPPPVPGFCVAQQEITSGTLASGWISPSGTLYAVGATVSSRVRAPDGTWTLDPAELDVRWNGLIDGADDGEVWALTVDDARRRDADGTWTDMGAPADFDELRGLRVFGAGDVLALKVEEQACADCAARQTPVLLWWDGAAWTSDVKPEIRGYVDGMTVLPDRTVVLAAAGGLRVIDPAPASIPTPPELYARSVTSAPDGTLVALGDGPTVAIGTVAGLALFDPGIDVDGWSAAWASSATDVWISGEWWERGVVPHGVIARWDGAAWSTVVADAPGDTFRLVGRDGQVFAVGGYDHELVLVGDASGLAVDREVWSPDYLNEIVVDDVTGAAWGYGYNSVLGKYEGGAWVGVPLPDRSIDPDKIAASGGRVLLSHAGEALHVLDDGVLETTPAPGSFYYWLAGADGVLFAAGEAAGPDEESPGPRSLLQEAGAGWTPIDLAGIPADAETTALWADGATDLWMGLALGRRGGLAHWDGAGWTVVLDDLPAEPGWMRRLSDGQLYFTQFSGAGEGTESLWAFDGTTATPVPDMPPDVRAAHLLPDGTWYASVISRAATADEDLFGRLMEKLPGQDWTEVFRTDYGVSLVGDEDTVWAEQDALSWTRAPCSP